MQFVSKRTLIAACCFTLAAYALIAASRSLDPPELKLYRLPLVGQYSIYRTDLRIPMTGTDTHYLSRQGQFPNGRRHDHLIVSGLKQYAMHNQMIVGTTERQFFIFDTSTQDLFPDAQTYRDAAAWQNALRNAGIPTDITLKDPDTEAAQLPDNVIRAYDYTVLKGLLGRSDSTWSVIIQFQGLCLCFIIGLFAPLRISLFGPSVLIGLLINFIAQVALVDLEPAAFVGCVGLPIVYLIAAHLGRLPLRIWKICTQRNRRFANSPNM